MELELVEVTADTGRWGKGEVEYVFKRPADGHYVVVVARTLELALLNLRMCAAEGMADAPVFQCARITLQLSSQEEKA